MGYTYDDLSLFEPFLDAEMCVGTSYFELHPKELPRPHACWLSGSFFIRDAAFDFFVECFLSASDSFDYFSFQRFGEPEIARLVQELESFIYEIGHDPSREQIFSRYTSIFTSKIWSEVELENLAPAVCRCGQQMLSFIQSSTRESQCLWVLGM